MASLYLPSHKSYRKRSWHSGKEISLQVDESAVRRGYAQSLFLIGIKKSQTAPPNGIVNFERFYSKGVCKFDDLPGKRQKNRVCSSPDGCNDALGDDQEMIQTRPMTPGKPLFTGFSA
jgi:hypothetical protein